MQRYSLLPSRSHLCTDRLVWHAGGIQREQIRDMSAGDALGLARLLEAPLFVSDERPSQRRFLWPEAQMSELIFASYLLKQERFASLEKLRPGYEETPLHDALVKELRACVPGKAPARGR